MPRSGPGFAIPSVTEPWDLTQATFAALVLDVAKDLAGAQAVLAGDSLEPPEHIALGTAVKCAQSLRSGRRIQQHLEATGERLSVRVVEAVYREADRLSARTAANPHGEDAFAFRLRTLDDIAELFPNISTGLLVVDDGCDGNGEPARNSGEVARSLYRDYLARHPRKTDVVVTDGDVLLDEAAELGWAPAFERSSESRKGGSVVGGFAKVLSAHDPAAQVVVIDSDADLSIHPLQMLLLVEKIVVDGVDAAIASRRTSDAVAAVDPDRDGRGQAFIRSWQAMMPALARKVTDTNRGLKAYSASSARIIVDTVKDPTFVYQMESLLVLALQDLEIAEVGVSYIDSVALSTQAGEDAAQGYDDQIERFGSLVERHGKDS